MNPESKSTAFYRLAPGAARREAIAQAGAILRAGGIVLMPTDTVYGIACLASDERARQAIARMKGQSPDKPFQILPASVEAALEQVEAPSRVARKLMRVYWPGPLTLVLPAPDGSTVGMRLPEHPDARAIIREAGAPLAASSANRHGAAPAANAEEALEEFDGEVDAVLDGGSERLGASSSVVRIDGESIEVLREEAVAEEEIRRAAQYAVLFVPQPQGARAFIAAVIARHMLAGLGADVRVAVAVSDEGEFAGVWTSGVEEVLSEMGYPAEPPSIVSNSAPELDLADEIFVLEERAMRDLARLMPETEPRLRLLDLEAPEFPKPSPGGIGVGLGYRATAVRLERVLWEPCKRIATTLGLPTA